MLILTRRIGESVYIGDEVRLTVLGVRGTQVRIGINAPKDIPVHREEIYYKIKHEQGGDESQRGNEYAPGENSENTAGNTAENAAATESRGENVAENVAENVNNADADEDDEEQPSAEEADPHNV